MRVRKITVTLTLVLLLAACAPATASITPIPTGTLLQPILPEESVTGTFPVVSPTIGATPTPTFESSFTPEPTLTLLPITLPSQVPPPATLVATALPQPLAGSSAIQILAPGPLSKLLSPLGIYGYAIPGYNSQGMLVLYGEDGRVLDSELLQLYTAYTWAFYSWSLNFTVQGAGELGRLTLSTRDEYGRLTAANSVHLLLLPEGNSIVNPPGDLRERCVLEQRAPGHRYSGGTLQVNGLVRPYNSLPLVVQMIDRTGSVVASQAVPIEPAADDRYLPFTVDLTYSVPTSRYVRLSVSQADDRISGLMYLYSQEIYIYP